jgi:hypothetical protein
MLILSLMIIFISSCSEALEENTNLPTKKLSLINGSTVINLTVEVATSPKEREVGLMFRKSLDMDKGMLFILSDKRIRKFWMKNTFIPLDMIFFDEQKIVGLVENAKPHDLTAVGPEKPSDKVLEVPAGFIQLHKVDAKWLLN